MKRKQLAGFSALLLTAAMFTACADETDTAVEAGSDLDTQKLDSISIGLMQIGGAVPVEYGITEGIFRSEEHTSELQSRFELVCRLLPEKTKPAPPRSTRAAADTPLRGTRRICPACRSPGRPSRARPAGGPPALSRTISRPHSEPHRPLP